MSGQKASIKYALKEKESIAKQKTKTKKYSRTEETEEEKKSQQLSDSISRKKFKSHKTTSEFSCSDYLTKSTRMYAVMSRVPSFRCISHFSFGFFPFHSILAALPEVHLYKKKNSDFLQNRFRCELVSLIFASCCSLPVLFTFLVIRFNIREFLLFVCMVFAIASLNSLLQVFCFLFAVDFA